MAAPQPQPQIPPLPPPDRRRYLTGRPERAEQFLKAAADYADQFETQDFDWCYGKPFDRAAGNPQFQNAVATLCGVLQVMNLHQGASILEVGSGPGWLTEMLVALGYKVVALDPAAAMHTLSRRRLDLAAKHWRLPLPLPVTYLAEPLETCTLPDESVDAVLFYESLHHVIDERAGLGQAFRVLRPGGVLCVACEWAWAPGLASLEADIEKEMAEYGTLENPYTKEYLDHLLAANGFVNRVRYHAVCGLFPADKGARTVAEVAFARASATNCLTARKPDPDARVTTADPSAPARATVSVRSASLGADRVARVECTVRNTGEVDLLARRAGDLSGVVMVSLCRDPHGGIAEVGRGHLPRSLAPGESAAVTLALPLPPGLPADGWYVALVNEGHYWFHLRAGGPAPTPVAFG